MAAVSKTICYIVCIVIAMVDAIKLPKGFQQCKKSDPDLNECLRRGLQSAVPHLANGIPSLGIIPLDPLRITELIIDQGPGPVSIRLQFKDLDILNLNNSTIRKLDYDTEKYRLFVEVEPPKIIELVGDYEITGKALIFPIVGKGRCKISLDIPKFYDTVTMKPVEKGGNTFLEVDTISWKFTPSKLILKFDNLFNGDKALGDNMNVFLNENWREVFTDLQPAIEKIFGIAFRGIGQQFLNRIPINKIILD